MATELGRSLEIKNLTIEAGTWQWRQREELFAGLAKEIRGLPLAISPLPGAVWWVMAEQDLKKLMSMLLAKQPAPADDDIDNDFVKAFYRFLAVEALNAFENTVADKKLSPTLAAEEGLPDAHCLCLDVAINIEQKNIQARLFLSPEFRTAWKLRYLQQQPNISLASPMANSLDIIVHLEAGRIDLKLSEWKQIKTGDFIFLDNCSLDPDEDKGRVMLVINGIPCFRARIKQGSLKILEHPLYHEANTSMDETTNTDDENMFDDEDLKDDDLDPASEHAAEESSADFDIDEISDSELDLDEDSSTDASPPTPTASPAASAATSAVKAASVPSSIEDLPLPVVIEIGRIQMSIKKLLELQPGNMLELDIHPETGVDLVVNGKRVARGELLRIGEALGVRILELS